MEKRSLLHAGLCCSKLAGHHSNNSANNSASAVAEPVAKILELRALKCSVGFLVSRESGSITWNPTRVWVSPGGLGAVPGAWQVTEPWAIGMVLETKGHSIQLQIEKAESAGRRDLQGAFRAGVVHWFSEDILTSLEEGRREAKKRQPAHAALSKAFYWFGLRGEPALPEGEIAAALATAREQNDGSSALALELLQADTDKSRPLKKRLDTLRALLIGDKTAQVTAGGLLAAWVRDKGWERRTSGPDFSKDRRQLVVRPYLDESVPGAMAGVIAISIYERLNAVPTRLPTKKELAALDAADKALWEIALDGAAKGQLGDRSALLKNMLAESRRLRLEGYRAYLLRKLEVRLQRYVEEDALAASEHFKEYLKTQFQDTEKAGQHWPLREQDMMSFLARAEQAAQQARKNEEARQAQEALERKIAERDRKLLEEVKEVTVRFVAALKQKDLNAACRLADSIPVRGKESSMAQTLVSPWGENNIANAFVPNLVRIRRYEEYEKPVWGADALVEAEMDTNPSGKGKRLQFRRIQGKWWIYSGPWWDNQGGKHLEKRCRDYRNAEKK